MRRGKKKRGWDHRVMLTQKLGGTLTVRAYGFLLCFTDGSAELTRSYETLICFGSAPGSLTVATSRMQIKKSGEDALSSTFLPLTCATDQ